jgi:hypothetical protein
VPVAEAEHEPVTFEFDDFEMGKAYECTQKGPRRVLAERRNPGTSSLWRNHLARLLRARPASIKGFD